MAETYSGDFYLVISPKRWAELSGRLSRKQPALGPNERVMKLHITVPKSLFKQPTLQATVTIPEGVVPGPVIETQVLDNVQECLNQTTGMDFQLRMVTKKPLSEVSF